MWPRRAASDDQAALRLLPSIALLRLDVLILNLKFAESRRYVKPTELDLREEIL